MNATALTSALAVVGLLLAPASTHAVWYAQPGSDGSIGRCVKAEESIDDAWRHVERGWAAASHNPKAKCSLILKDSAVAAGFAFDCGEGGDHFFFRTQANCETFKRVMNAKASFSPSEFAPEGVGDSTIWAASLAACMQTLVKEEAIATVGLRAISSVCECQAATVAESGKAAAKGVAGDALVACIKASPGDTGSKLIAAIKAAGTGAPGATPARNE